MKMAKRNLVRMLSASLLFLFAAGCEKDSPVADVPDTATLNALRTAYDDMRAYNDSLADCLLDTYWIHQDSLSWLDRVHYCDGLYHQCDATFNQVNLNCQQQIQTHTGSHHMGGNMGANYSHYKEYIGHYHALAEQHQQIHPHF